MQKLGRDVARGPRQREVAIGRRALAVRGPEVEEDGAVVRAGPHDVLGLDVVVDQLAGVEVACGGGELGPELVALGPCERALRVGVDELVQGLAWLMAEEDGQIGGAGVEEAGDVGLLWAEED